jgi:hypothetical protein
MSVVVESFTGFSAVSTHACWILASMSAASTYNFRESNSLTIDWDLQSHELLSVC